MTIKDGIRAAYNDSKWIRILDLMKSINLSTPFLLLLMALQIGCYRQNLRHTIKYDEICFPNGTKVPKTVNGQKYEMLQNLDF